MKKLFLKSLALVAMLLCGLTASASNGLWCAKRIGHFSVDGADGADVNSYVLLTVKNNGDGTITFTVANDPGKNSKDVDYILINPGYGSAGTDVDSNAPMSQSVTYTLPAGTTELKGVEILWSNSGWPGRWMVQGLDIAVSDMCTDESAETETIKPVMGAASLASVTHNSAVLNVAGTDKETEEGEDVAVTRFKVVYGETTKTYTASNGQITITGLTAGTPYSFNIYAVDAAGNVSDNFATVEVTTESLTYCDFATGHLGDANFGDANGRILLTLKQTAANKVQVTVKPNTENGATKLLDYLYVAPSGAKEPTYTAGADIAEGDGETSMSVEVAYEALPATMDFHLEWSNPAWDGRWALDVKGVTADMLCSDKTTTMPAVVSPVQNVQKRIENGMLIIYRDNKAYTVLGTAL